MGIPEPAERERSDTELLVAHVAGDRRAFGELFCRHQRQLYRVARLTSRCPQDAEDALQEAMLSAHRSAGSFRHDAAVRSWLHRIVLNACLDRLRRNASRPTVPLNPLGHDCPVADRTGHVDTSLMIQAALTQLPLGQRAAVVAVDMQGLSVAETAQLLGIPEGTVKSRCARGRARLAVLLGYLSTPAEQH